MSTQKVARYHRNVWHGITEISIQADQILKDVNSFDKSLAEKLAFIDGLNKKDKIGLYAVLDAFIGNKKLKDGLSNVLSDVK